MEKYRDNCEFPSATPSKAAGSPALPVCKHKRKSHASPLIYLGWSTSAICWATKILKYVSLYHKPYPVHVSSDVLVGHAGKGWVCLQKCRALSKFHMLRAEGRTAKIYFLGP